MVVEHILIEVVEHICICLETEIYSMDLFESLEAVLIC